MRWENERLPEIANPSFAPVGSEGGFFMCLIVSMKKIWIFEKAYFNLEHAIKKERTPGQAASAKFVSKEGQYHKIVLEPGM